MTESPSSPSSVLCIECRLKDGLGGFALILDQNSSWKDFFDAFSTRFAALYDAGDGNSGWTFNVVDSTGNLFLWNIFDEISWRSAIRSFPQPLVVVVRDGDDDANAEPGTGATRKNIACTFALCPYCSLKSGLKCFEGNIFIDYSGRIVCRVDCLCDGNGFEFVVCSDHRFFTRMFGNGERNDNVENPDSRVLEENLGFRGFHNSGNFFFHVDMLEPASSSSKSFLTVEEIMSLVSLSRSRKLKNSKRTPEQSKPSRVQNLFRRTKFNPGNNAINSNNGDEMNCIVKLNMGQLPESEMSLLRDHLLLLSEKEQFGGGNTLLIEGTIDRLLQLGGSGLWGKGTVGIFPALKCFMCRGSEIEIASDLMEFVRGMKAVGSPPLFLTFEVDSNALPDLTPVLDIVMINPWWVRVCVFELSRSLKELVPAIRAKNKQTQTLGSLDVMPLLALIEAGTAGKVKSSDFYPLSAGGSLSTICKMLGLGKYDIDSASPAWGEFATLLLTPRNAEWGQSWPLPQVVDMKQFLEKSSISVPDGGGGGSSSSSSSIMSLLRLTSALGRSALPKAREVFPSWGTSLPVDFVQLMGVRVRFDFCGIFAQSCS